MKNLFLIIFVSILLTSCASSGDAFKLKKKSSGDEFLVEKKSPLVLPPDYGKLPKPDEYESDENASQEDSFKEKISKNEKTKQKEQNNSTSIEKSVLDKIK